MSDKYGMIVIKDKVIKASSPKDYLLSSENVLLKIHKQSSFTIRTIFGGGTATIRFDDLKKRPVVLVYAQRFNTDGTVDNSYHLYDFSYFGATQIGEYKVEIYNDHIVISISDGNANIARFADIFGYFYIFKEEVSA